MYEPRRDDPGPNFKVSERGRCDYNFVVYFNFGVMTFVRHNSKSTKLVKSQEIVYMPLYMACTYSIKKSYLSEYFKTNEGALTSCGVQSANYVIRMCEQSYLCCKFSANCKMPS